MSRPRRQCQQHVDNKKDSMKSLMMPAVASRSPESGDAGQCRLGGGKPFGRKMRKEKVNTHRPHDCGLPVELFKQQSQYAIQNTFVDMPACPRAPPGGPAWSLGRFAESTAGPTALIGEG